MTATYAAVLGGCLAFTLFATMLGGRALGLPRKWHALLGAALAIIVLTTALLTHATY